MRKAAFWFFTALVFAVCNGMIVQKERLKANGQQMFLELNPRAPDSNPFPGNYLPLTYELLSPILIDTIADGGCLVVKLDKDNVASFDRIVDGTQLSQGEHLFRFRKRKPSEVAFGPTMFLFREQQSRIYAPVHYAELRVAPNGEALLVGLRDKDLKPLSP